MSSGRPPFTRSSPPVDPRLDAARGSLRDTIGALRNLEQLLKSVRVGPRALSAVIPDVRGSLDSLLGAERVLFDAISAQLPDARAEDAIERFMSPRVETLERALLAAEHRPLHAKNRLALEQVVTTSTRELDVARALVELLEEAAHGPRTGIDLLEVLRGASKTADRTAGENVSITMSSSERNVELLANPRVAMSLVAIGVKLVGMRIRDEAPHVSITRTPEACAVTIQDRPVGGERLLLVTQPLIAPTLSCAEAAARLSAARLEWNAERSLFALYWPTAAGS